MNARVISLPPAAQGTSTDALTDRVNTWVSLALTKAKVKPVAETDKVIATVPPFRKLCGLSETEAGALDDLRDKLIEHARSELCAGRELHTWESNVPANGAESASSCPLTPWSAAWPTSTPP